VRAGRAHVPHARSKSTTELTAQAAAATAKTATQGEDPPAVTAQYCGDGRRAPPGAMPGRHQCRSCRSRPHKRQARAQRSSMRIAPKTRDGLPAACVCTSQRDLVSGKHGRLKALL